MTVAAGVKAGDFVSWRASRGEGRGQVVSVHTSSHVPAVPVRIAGSVERPAARLRVYAKVEGGWVPTDTYVALHADKLTSIDALAAPPTPATEALTPGSFDDIRQRVRLALKAKLAGIPGNPADPWVWVADIGPGWVVFESGPTLWMASYLLLDDGTVEIGEPVEVYELTTYVPVTEAEGEQVEDRLTGRLLEASGAGSDRTYRVQILEYGLSANGRMYSADVMRAAARLYEGARAYDHHLTPEERRSGTVQGLIGSYHNVVATETGLDADLRLLPSAKHVAEAFDRSLELQAAGLSPLVGISHDVLARTEVRLEGGRRIEHALEIVAVASADVVASPASGGKATRLVASRDPLNPNHQPTIPGGSVNLKQLLALLRTADAAKRVELLTEHAAVITAAGLDNTEAVRLAEAADTATPPPAPAPTGNGAPVQVVETRHAKTSQLARMLAATTVQSAGLDERLVESVLAELPDQFTEPELTARVDAYRRIAEGFEKAGLKPTVPSAQVTTDERDRKAKALDAMLAGDYSIGYRSIKEAWADWTGHRVQFLGAEDINRQILRESVYIDPQLGRPFDSGAGVGQLTESVISSTWAFALGDAITRRMVAAYKTPGLDSWRRIVSSTPPLNDFRTQRIQRVGGYGTLPTVAEGGTYQPLTSPSNDTETTYTPAKRGGTEDLTLEAIANDDLRIVQDIPRKLGRSAALTLYVFVWDFFTANAAINDGVALFHASHNNTASSALSASALSAVRLKMLQQVGYGHATQDVLQLSPKFLIVPSTLEELAFQLTTSAVALPAGAPVGAASNIPNFHTNLEFIRVDYWTSQTQWYLAADPNDVPTLEIGFYQGRQDPELFTQADPTQGSVWAADKISYKVRHIYGGSILDYRGLQRGNS